MPDGNGDEIKNGNRYPYLVSRLREACRAIEASNPRISAILFWLLTMGTMAVFDPSDEKWTRQKWTDVARTLPNALTSWEGAHPWLQGVLWIPCVHDEPGKKAYKELNQTSYNTAVDPAMLW